MEESNSTRLLLSAEVSKLNLTLGVFNMVLERMCHIEEVIKYRDFFVGVQVIKHMVPLICRILPLRNNFYNGL